MADRARSAQFLSEAGESFETDHEHETEAIARWGRARELLNGVSKVIHPWHARHEVERRKLPNGMTTTRTHDLAHVGVGWEAWVNGAAVPIVASCGWRCPDCGWCCE